MAHLRLFLEDLPDDALCSMDNGRFAIPCASGCSPIRKRLARTSQSDIHGFVHAMFEARHSVGYIRINPVPCQRSTLSSG